MTILTELSEKPDREKQFLFQAIRAALTPIPHLGPCFRGVSERALQQVVRQEDVVERLLRTAIQHLGPLAEQSINQGLDNREFSRYLQTPEAQDQLKSFAWQIETQQLYYQALSESLLLLAQSSGYRETAPAFPEKLLGPWQVALRVFIYWAASLFAGLLVTDKGGIELPSLAILPGLLAGGETVLKKYGEKAVACLAPAMGAICGIAAFFLMRHELPDSEIRGLSILLVLCLAFGIVGIGLLGRILNAIAQRIIIASECEFRWVLAGQGSAALLLFTVVDALPEQISLVIVIVLTLVGGYLGGLVALHKRRLS